MNNARMVLLRWDWNISFQTFSCARNTLPDSQTRSMCKPEAFKAANRYATDSTRLASFLILTALPGSHKHFGGCSEANAELLLTSRRLAPAHGMWHGWKETGTTISNYVHVLGSTHSIQGQTPVLFDRLTIPALTIPALPLQSVVAMRL